MHARKAVALLIATTCLSPMFISCDTSVDFWDERDILISIPSDSASAGGASCTKDSDCGSQLACTANPPTVPTGVCTVYKQAGTQVVDLSQDSAITGQLKSISSIQVVEVWLKLNCVAGDPAAAADAGTMAICSTTAGDNAAKFASGSLQVAGPPDSSGAINWQTVGVYNHLAIADGASIQIVPSAEQQAQLAQIETWASTSPYKFQINFQGQFEDANMNVLTGGGVNFSIKSRIHLLATVGL